MMKMRVLLLLLMVSSLAVAKDTVDVLIDRMYGSEDCSGPIIGQGMPDAFFGLLDTCIPFPIPSTNPDPKIGGVVLTFDQENSRVDYDFFRTANCSSDKIPRGIDRPYRPQPINELNFCKNLTSIYRYSSSGRTTKETSSIDDITVTYLLKGGNISCADWKSSPWQGDTGNWEMRELSFVFPSEGCRRIGNYSYTYNHANATIFLGDKCEGEPIYENPQNCFRFTDSYSIVFETLREYLGKNIDGKPSTNSDDKPSTDSNTGVIVGVAIGVVIVAVILGLGINHYHKKKSKNIPGRNATIEQPAIAPNISGPVLQEVPRNMSHSIVQA